MSAPADEQSFTPEEEARIRQHIRERGMAFETFLPEGMADWLRAKLDAGIFESPREAAFIAFQQLIELDRHPEVKRQLLAASIQSSIDDPRPSIPADEAFAQIRARLCKLASPDQDG